MKSAMASSPAEILDQYKETRLKGLASREADAQEARSRLRESTVQLREPNHHPAIAPANSTAPSFKLGDAKGFPYVTEHGETKPGQGHLSDKGAEAFYGAMAKAIKTPDVAGRTASIGEAARAVAQDWASKHGLLGQHHGKHDPLSNMLHEGRAQVAFTSREVGQKLGLNVVESTLIGHSLERALEKEGFKVFANHAIDKSAEFFKATASSVATSSGMRHSAESTLNKSFNWMVERGVTREGLKEALGKHIGKLGIVLEVSRHPEVVQKVAHALSKSDRVYDGVMMLANDNEFRKSVGTLTLSAGETLASVNKGAGSIAILAGSALRGDSTEETARHAFRAALTVIGGAAGGLAGGGVASLATGTAGAMAGSWVADKLLNLYDQQLGKGPLETQRTVSREEAYDSSKVIADRVATRLKEDGQHLVDERKISGKDLDRDRELVREYSKGKFDQFKPT